MSEKIAHGWGEAVLAVHLTEDDFLEYRKEL